MDKQVIVGRPETSARVGNRTEPRVTQETYKSEREIASRAILVVHGMGQQIPFQSLEDAADLLRKIDSKGRFEVKTLPDPDGAISFARWTDSRGNTIDLYEAYWAYCTAGQIGLTRVVQFLAKAAFFGALRSTSEFRRFGFDKVLKFGVRSTTPIGLILALVTTLGVVIWSALAVASLTAAAICLEFPSLTSGVCSRLELPEWTARVAWTLLCLIIAVLFSLFVSWVAARTEPALRHRRAEGPKFKADSTTVEADNEAPAKATAAKERDHYRKGPAGVAPFLCGLSLASACLASPWLLHFWTPSYYFSVAACFVMTILFLIIRGFMIDYLGDVAIYVSSNSLNRYVEIRKAILTECKRVARAAYASHDQVTVLAHSLGSVIAYDALNALTNEDLANGTDITIMEKTVGLITYGSPLDKTAFLFRIQGSVKA